MTTIKPRDTLDRQIQELLDQVILLGSMVEKTTLDAVNALKNNESETAQRVYDYDGQVNKKRFEIEETCLKSIATQQPMAGDLRILASILDVATELERMGDYAKGIARICIMMDGQPPVKPITDLPPMADFVVEMLHKAVGAFVNADADLARQIPKDDDRVDDYYNQINRVMITYMISDPSLIDRANLIIWAAHNLERMADRVTNICERTIYVATGEMKELDISDDELKSVMV